MDVLRVGHHVGAEAVHDQDLRRQVLLGHQLVERIDDVVHVARHHLPDLRARAKSLALVMHVELGVDAEVHVGALEVLEQERQLGLQRAVSRLNVDEQQPLAALRPAVRLLDRLRVLSPSPAAVGPRGALRDDGHEVDRGDHRRRRIGRLPLLDRLVEHREHLLLGVLAEHAHLLRVRVAVVRDDAVLRQ